MFQDKVVVVRDTEGTLRTATQEERDRAIQIAFPVRGRTIFPSSFFKPENLHVRVLSLRLNCQSHITRTPMGTGP